MLDDDVAKALDLEPRGDLVRTFFYAVLKSGVALAGAFYMRSRPTAA